MITPPPLCKGDLVAITAPAGPVVAEKLTAGVAALERLGLRVRIMPSCHGAHGFLAAHDDVRLHDLHEAFATPQIRAVFAARGGYGSARLLPRIDFGLIARNPKIFAGYSDITALHIAFNQICKLVTFHAPMPAADLFKEDADTLESFVDNLFAPLRTGNPATQAPPITGGNLTIIAASLGTPYEIDTRNRLLFMEETNEPPYKIDRLLTQLHQADKLKNAAGFILGDFSPETTETLAQSINEILTPLNKPIITGFPAGHTMPNITLPLGAILSSHQLQTHARLETAMAHKRPF